MTRFRIEIAAGMRTPIYRQIVDQVRLGIAAGTLRVGDGLPSVRALAARLTVNPNTVAKAYAQLVRDGVLESRPGRGVFVARKRQVFSDAERARRLQAALDALVHEAVGLDFSPEEIRRALAERLEGLTATQGEPSDE